MIATALGEAGYVVDVADVRAARIPRGAGPYSLILTHHPSLELIQAHLHEDTRVVYLATGMQHSEHNRLVNARRVALEMRRRCRIPAYTVNDEKMSILARADAIAGFGNQATMGTWADVFAGPIHFFDNSGFGWIRPQAEPAPDCSRHFLFFGSVDQVRKGLDLLLETFPYWPDLHLHVAGYYAREPEFCECYRQELYETPNIHLHGEIEVGSAQWQFLVTQCAYVILPSCSEGQAGSVIQAMHAGLIPVVTLATGLDVACCGEMLPDEPEPVLKETVRRLADMPAEALSHRRREVLATARTKYSETAFLARWREIARNLAGVDEVTEARKGSGMNGDAAR